MKKIFVISLTFLIVFTSTIAFATEESNGAALMADTLIARPIGLVTIGIGGTLFIISFPFAVISGSLDKTAKAFIVDPFKYTFTRPLGDFDRKSDSKRN